VIRPQGGIAEIVETFDFRGGLRPRTARMEAALFGQIADRTSGTCVRKNRDND
jgi:hypothetical protein